MAPAVESAGRGLFPAAPLWQIPLAPFDPTRWRAVLSNAHPLSQALRAKARHWSALWGVPDLSDSVRVEFSTRMRVSLGLCRPAQNRIRLAASLLNGGDEDSGPPAHGPLAHATVPSNGGSAEQRPEAPSGEGGLSDGRPTLLEEVLCHELAHAAVHRLHGRRAKPHGPEWKALMVKAGHEPRVRVLENDPRLPADFNRPRPRWEHRCPVCQVKQLAGRPVRQWRCLRCRKAGRSGKLEIRKVLPGGHEGCSESGRCSDKKEKP